MQFMTIRECHHPSQGENEEEAARKCSFNHTIDKLYDVTISIIHIEQLISKYGENFRSSLRLIKSGAPYLQ